MVRVPRECGDRAWAIATEHGAVNPARWGADGEGGEQFEMLLVHLANEDIGALADAMEVLPDVRLSVVTTSALALHPPKEEVAQQMRDVSHLSPLEVYVSGLQSVGSWKGFLSYAVLGGVVVWLGLTTNTVFLLIGAMLIAPYGSPAMNTALATARGDSRLLGRSLARYAASLAVTIAVAALLALVFRQREATEQMIAVTRVSPLALLLPLAAGAAGALTLAQSQRSSLVSGAGAGLLVAASLAPPAGVLGASAAIGRWELMNEASFLLALQLVGINLSGAVVFRMFGVGPKGLRFPHGSRAVAWGSFAAFAAALALLLGWQFGSNPPTLVRAGIQEEAREVVSETLREDPEIRLLDVDATFPRPRASENSPLVVQVYVQWMGASPAPSDLKSRVEARLEGALDEQTEGVVPLVDVTVLQARR